MAEKFSITRGSGYRMTFANGWALSVQWGAFNYCERNDLNATPDSDGFYSSPNAEVAVFKPNGNMARVTEYETVLGWQTPDQVAALMGLVASGAFVEYEPADEGESGQDRESYSDDQDRESYYVEPDEGEDDPRSGVDGWGQT